MLITVSKSCGKEESRQREPQWDVRWRAADSRLSLHLCKQLLSPAVLCDGKTLAVKVMIDQDMHVIKWKTHLRAGSPVLMEKQIPAVLDWRAESSQSRPARVCGKVQTVCWMACQSAVKYLNANCIRLPWNLAQMFIFHRQWTLSIFKETTWQLLDRLS